MTWFRGPLADGDKDGKLTLSEMVSNSMAFYSTAMNDNDEYPYHDEFKKKKK